MVQEKSIKTVRQKKKKILQQYNNNCHLSAGACTANY